MKKIILLSSTLLITLLVGCSNQVAKNPLEERSWIGMDVNILMDTENPDNVQIYEVGLLLHGEKYGELTLGSESREPLIVIVQCKPDEENLVKLAVTRANNELPLPSLNDLTSINSFDEKVQEWLPGCERVFPEIKPNPEY